MIRPAIAIIGGGPCGLTLATLLERKGIDYVVFERDEDANSNLSAGGSLDLHPETGQLALRAAGLFDTFQQHARYEDTVFSIADKSGNKVVELGQGRDAPEIDRSALRQILLDAVPKDKIKWGHVLTSATLGRDHTPVLHFANGVVESGFKLAVGADGAWSKVRSLVCVEPPLLKKLRSVLLIICRSHQQSPNTPGRAISYRQSAVITPSTETSPTMSAMGVPWPSARGGTS